MATCSMENHRTSPFCSSIISTTYSSGRSKSPAASLSTPHEPNRKTVNAMTSSDGSDTVSTRHSLPQHLSSPPRCKDTTLNIVHNLSKLLQHNIKYCILNNASLSQLNLTTFSIKIRHKAQTQKRANV